MFSLYQKYIYYYYCLLKLSFKFAFLLSSMFISMYGFRQAFRLNLMTLWNFFKTNLWFNASFKFLMWITYSFLSCKLATSFSLFQFSFFQAKRVNHCEGYVIFHDIELHLQEKSFITFYEALTKFTKIFNALKTIYR